jgi:hypothetical protein
MLPTLSAKATPVLLSPCERDHSVANPAAPATREAAVLAWLVDDDDVTPAALVANPRFRPAAALGRRNARDEADAILENIMLRGGESGWLVLCLLCSDVVWRWMLCLSTFGWVSLVGRCGEVVMRGWLGRLICFGWVRRSLAHYFGWLVGAPFYCRLVGLL